MKRIKEKKINVPLTSDNIGRADFHMFSWYFVTCNILFLLIKLSHLVGQKERANCPIESKFHLTEMALNSDVQLWNQTCIHVFPPPFLIGWCVTLNKLLHLCEALFSHRQNEDNGNYLAGLLGSLNRGKRS